MRTSGDKLRTTKPTSEHPHSRIARSKGVGGGTDRWRVTDDGWWKLDASRYLRVLLGGAGIGDSGDGGGGGG